MAERVFLHIGLPKTGTSYLQTILWANRRRLGDAGVWLPGVERRDHLWSSLVVRGDEGTAVRNELAPTSWTRVVDEAAEWPYDVLVSHEFFSSATEEQARAALAAFAPAEVHLVVTGRDALGLFTASWQESIKNKGIQRIADYGRTVSDNPLVVWDWRALDLGLVLQRWTADLPPERVHVLPMPPSGSPRELLWQRFASVLGLDADGFDLSGSFPNESMGVVETETLRRINGGLVDFDLPRDRGVWVRTYLADERLVPRQGERYWPGEDQIEECRKRSHAAVDLVERTGFDVVGDLADLLVPDELPQRRHPDSVTDTEVAQVAVDTVARMLTDVRALTREKRGLTRRLEKALEPPPPPPPMPSIPRRAVNRLGRDLRRVWPRS